MAKEKKEAKKKEKIIRRSPTEVKKKKKRWASILASKSFGSKFLGESLIGDSQELKNKRVVVSLSSLGRGKNSSAKVIFEVKEVVEGSGVCEAIGYFILSGFARRIVRKGKTKITRTFKFKTKDDINVILKLALVTKTKISGSVGRAIRKELDLFIKDEINKNRFEDMLNSVIDYKLQKNIREDLKKIYPIVSLEILAFKRV